jgi:hypothetical protein
MSAAPSLAPVTPGFAAWVPLDWIHPIERLLEPLAEPGWSRPDWLEMQAALRHFLDGHGQAAAKLCWTAKELFGMAPPPASAVRIDQRGLVTMLHRGAVVKLDAAQATVRCPDGTLQTFRRGR